MSIEDIEQAIKDQKIYEVGDIKGAIIAKSGTVSNAVDLGGHYACLQIVIPTLDTAQLELQASMELDGTYQDLGQDALTDSGTGAFNDTWNLGGWRFIKVKASAAQDTAARTFIMRGITY